MVGCGVSMACNHGKVRLFGVDLWTKGGGRAARFAHYSSDETWRIFKKQIAALGLEDVVHAVIGESVASAKKRSKPIHLLFIDAGHDYKNVLSDFKAWEKFVPIGGWIAFHDYNTRFKGVDRVIHEECIASGNWGDAAVYGRIWSARRIG